MSNLPYVAAAAAAAIAIYALVRGLRSLSEPEPEPVGRMDYQAFPEAEPTPQPPFLAGPVYVGLDWGPARGIPGQIDSLPASGVVYEPYPGAFDSILGPEAPESIPVTVSQPMPPKVEVAVPEPVPQEPAPVARGYEERYKRASRSRGPKRKKP